MPESVSKLYRALIFDGRVSLAVLDTTAVVNEAIGRHHLSPVAAAALGRTLTAAAYLAGWLKEQTSTLSLSVDGGGEGGRIGVAADGALRVRGYIERPTVSLPPRADGKLDVGRCVGRAGTLTVIRDEGYGRPFVGSCLLPDSGLIDRAFEAYYRVSEQLPAKIASVVRMEGENCAFAGAAVL